VHHFFKPLNEGKRDASTVDRSQLLLWPEVSLPRCVVNSRGLIA
jgi:hypothetical protein